MKNRILAKSWLAPFLSLFLLGLASCSQQLPFGPVNMMVIQPVGPGCQYEIGTVSLQTIENISELRGLLGRVVSNPNDLESDPNILQMGLGFQSLDLRLSGAQNSFAPLDKNSLLGVSLYYAIEKGHFLFKNLDPAADLLSVVSNMKETLLVQNAILKNNSDAKDFYSDNAAYVQVPGNEGPRNYFLHFPNEGITSLPLGFNSGVLVHEYAHMVVQYLFHNKRSEAGKTLSTSSENTLAAFEEGFADYFAFLATNDPGFFHCSFPGNGSGGRDLSHRKTLTPTEVTSIKTGIDFDSHDGGSVWASVQYQIGESIGHQENGRSLIRFINNLASCSGLASAQASINFDVLRNCHLQALGSAYGSRAQQLYQGAFGAAGGF